MFKMYKFSPGRPRMANVVEAESIVGEAQKHCYSINGFLYALDLPAMKVNSPQNKL
jgi:hypothetical protein